MAEGGYSGGAVGMGSGGNGNSVPMEFKLDIKIKSIEKMLLPLMKQASTFVLLASKFDD